MRKAFLATALLASDFLASAVLASFMATNAMAQGKGDPIAGAEVFKKCEQCHSIGETIKPGNAGPALNGVIGRKSAYDKEFNYSPPMRSARLTWDEPTLARFLKSPKGLIAGTRMLFPGLSAPKDIEDVIAFMDQYDEMGRKKQ